MNKKNYGTFEDNSQIHVKSELTMFWRRKKLRSPNTRFVPSAFKTKIIIKMLLLCNLYQSWWVTIQLVHIGHCLNRKKSSLHVQNHNHNIHILSKTGCWFSFLSMIGTFTLIDVLRKPFGAFFAHNLPILKSAFVNNKGFFSAKLIKRTKCASKDKSYISSLCCLTVITKLFV